MSYVGKRKVILSDHGPQFISGRWCQTLGWEGITPKHMAVYHPQSNQVERVMREQGRIFRAYCHAKHSESPLYVKRVENWLNSTTHESTGYTPVSYTHLDVYKRQTLPCTVLNWPEELYNFNKHNASDTINV